MGISIILDDVWKIFISDRVSIEALRGISLEIPHDRNFVSIVGPSGSGKTTLLSLIAGLFRPTRGSIKVGDYILTEMSNSQLLDFRRKHIGFVFQNFLLIPYMNVLDNLTYPASMINSCSGDECTKKAVNILIDLGIVDKASRMPGELSGGEKQRVAIARALMKDPSIILADEPTGELDHKTASNIIKIFKKLSMRGIKVILATHDELIVRESDMIIYLLDGKVRKITYQ